MSTDHAHFRDKSGEWRTLESLVCPSDEACVARLCARKKYHLALLRLNCCCELRAFLHRRRTDRRLFDCSRLGGMSSFAVLAVPCGLLLVRVVTFPATSSFTSGISDAWATSFAPCGSASDLLTLVNTALQRQSRLMYPRMCSARVFHSRFQKLARRFRIQAFFEH
jgi:hypothetical protein